MCPACANFGLIGWPLEHSLSPCIHQAALKEMGICGKYCLFAIQPDENHLQAILDLLEHVRNETGLQGLNVTLPYKQSVLPLLDRLTPAALRIGAVNTIYMEDGLLMGDNTDAAGFLNDLQHLHLAAHAPALVLGAGGSARAVVFSLLQNGHPVTVAARQPEKARTLADSFAEIAAKPIRVLPLEAQYLARADEDTGLLVNTTPLGMNPYTETCPWPDRLPLPPQAAIYDLVYNPPETRLMQRARQSGLPARGGLGMLVEQAALAFERWTGRPAPRAVMQQAAQNAFQPAVRVSTQRKD